MSPAPNSGDDDDFGFSSEDEAELIALADASASQVAKRERSFSYKESSPKRQRPAIAASTIEELAVKALTEVFGLKAFRLKQGDVIARILTGGSATVVFPTGGGKSLCYQIPALVFSELDKLEGGRGERDGGITLVVSPLIALMKDQVDGLVRRGVKAAVLDSSKTRDEYFQTCDRLRNGELKLLYCAPERLNNEGFVIQMKNVRGGIRLLAIDEAHCISEWGHAFRPDYLKISRFATEIKAERVICLTATATPRVAKDICDAFGIGEEGLFQTPTYRSNLLLLAESATSKMQIYPRLFAFLRDNPGPSIIYVTLQKQSEMLAEDLRNHGFAAKAFHAGMETAVKTQLQDDFMRSENLIIVATIAFGMGIDKPNIRNVVHCNIPKSIESYSQEIGRAGRDGKVSTCIFYICGEDLYLREMFVRRDLASRDSVSRLLEDIFSIATVQLPVGVEFQASLSRQERDFDLQSTTLKSIYAKLELTHGLIRETTPLYSKYSFKPSAHYAARLASDKSRAAEAIRLYGKMEKTLCHVDVSAASAILKIPRADIVSKLNDWDINQVIGLRVSGVLNVYKILKPLPQTESERQRLVDDLFSGMERREKEALDRTEQIIDLITGGYCFALALSQHLGDNLPDGKAECGHCTWCLTHKVVVRPAPQPVPFNQTAFNKILRAVAARDDARLLARIAFGIKSPRTKSLKLEPGVLGSMDDHEFMVLLRAFTAECDRAKANQRRRR